MPTTTSALTVLVIDDQFEVARVIARALRGRVDPVDYERSPVRALERLRDGERYSVILCDLTMPEMGGVDLYERVAREVPVAAGAFVFMSGASDPHTLARVRATGRPLLEKPVGADELFALVRAAGGQ